MTALEDFRRGMEDNGLDFSGDIIADGQIHRFTPEGDRRGSNSGWYVLYSDSVLAGAFGCWRRDVSEKWSEKAFSNLDTDAQESVRRKIDEAKKAADEKRKESQTRAARKSESIWSGAEPASVEHPYLKNKRVGCHGIRQSKDRLVIPLRDADGELKSLQFIDTNGSKRFLKDGRVSGCFQIIGQLEGAEEIILAEGFATGAMLHEATEKPVVCVFNAGNLSAAGGEVRKLAPKTRLIICADDDGWDEAGLPRIADKNVGLAKAKETAAEIGALVIYPIFNNPRPGLTDFNDLQQEITQDEIKEQISQSIEREQAKKRAIALGDEKYFQERQSLAKASGMGLGNLDKFRHAHQGEDCSEECDEEKTLVDVLVKIGNRSDLFHCPDGTAFGTFRLKNHHETHSLLSSAFSDYLRYELYKKNGGCASDSALKTAVGSLAARARYEGPEKSVHIRTARFGNRIYIDLCDPGWRVIEICADGWSVKERTPVIFTRKPGMLPLPEPRQDGAIDGLWSLLNISEADRPLIAGFLVSSLRGEGPYFCLNLYGTEGSAKTTATRIARRNFDPNDADVASFPKDERDLAISAASQMCVTFENVSSLSGRQSDWLCRLATGGAFRTRTLYTNDEESILKFCRPAIINGIPNVVSRGDLASRSISIELEMIDESRRQEESDIEAKFHEVWPDIFGALCSALSHGLRSIGAVHDEFQGRLPRMADAALFATAAEEALGFEKGAFIARLNESQGMAREDLLESDPIAKWIIEYLSSSQKWSGTASELSTQLRDELPETVVKDRSFPKDATRISNHIRRIESLLKTQGISVERKREGKQRRLIFEKAENLASSASHSVTSNTTTGPSDDAVTLSDAENQDSSSAPMVETVI